VGKLCRVKRLSLGGKRFANDEEVERRDGDNSLKASTL
jgi:hypothetical protein